MAQSEEIGELAKALSKMQSVLGGTAKSKNNPFFKSKYSSLEDVWDAIREPLTDNGLSVVQTNRHGRETATTIFKTEWVPDIKKSIPVAVVGEDRIVSVVISTTLLHTSGQWISGELELVPLKNDPQALGSAITYGRRYGLAAITGVYQEDDDATGKRAQPKSQRGQPSKSDLYAEATNAFTEWAQTPERFTPDEMAEIDRCWNYQDKLIEMYTGYKMKLQTAGSSRKPDFGDSNG